MRVGEGFQRGSGFFPVEFALFHRGAYAMKGKGHLRRRVQHPRGQVHRAHIIGVFRRVHSPEGFVNSPSLRVERIPERQHLLIGAGHPPNRFSRVAMEHESRLAAVAQVFTLAAGHPGQRCGEVLVTNPIKLGGKRARILGEGDGFGIP